MIYFSEEMLVPTARDAGITVPPVLNDYDAYDYPHWDVFCNVQVGRPQPYPGVVEDNARVIAAISDNRILTVTMVELHALGFQ